MTDPAENDVAYGGGQAAGFACAACGGLAGTVRLVPAGEASNFGPPFGDEVHGSDGVAIEDWLCNSWHRVSSITWDNVREVLAAADPDAGALHTIDWELAPFWCRACKRCYCAGHWETMVFMDEGFYDYAEGICPAGHRQMIDD
jgi:hypothetical protein